jgi:predicted PurR-regulated permease PerM
MPTRPIIFWIATLAAVVAVVVLLRGVLLPFVAGIALAYLLSPIANRIERLGVSRGLATLSILVVVVVAIAVLVVLIVPTIVNEVSYLIENVPMYFRRLQAVSTDPNRPWLSKIVGEGLIEAERAFGELTNHTGDSLRKVLLSIWSGGGGHDISHFTCPRRSDYFLLPYL